MAMAASGLGSCAFIAAVCSSENCSSSRVPKRSVFCPPISSSGRFLSSEFSPCSAKFISLVSVASPRRVKRNAILALDPNFYKIPYVEGIPVGSKLKLFNLPPDDDRESLREELLEWFESIDITVVLLEFTDDPELNAQGVGGFVEMSTKMEACMAVARLDGSKFKGRYVRMDFVERRPHEREIGGRRGRPSYSSYSSDSRPSYASAPNPNKIFVGNLAWSMDDASLQRLFSSHGTVYEARVMRDRDSGRSRGFGFVVMSTADEMQTAISALDGQTVEGRPLKVNVATAR